MSERSRVRNVLANPNTRRVVTTSMATMAFFAMSTEGLSPWEQRVSHAFTEYADDTNQSRQSVRVGETIIAPPEPSPNYIASDWNYSSTPKCDTDDLTLTNHATKEQLLTAAEIPMGLSPGEYEHTAELLKAAESREDVQSIVANVFAEYGVTATFDQPETLVKVINEDKNYDARGRSYSEQFADQLKGLMYMPKAMLGKASEINFIDADVLRTNDGEQAMTITGMYLPDTRKIIIKTSAQGDTLIHEYAHGLHFDLCKDPTMPKQLFDPEQASVYMWAMRLLQEPQADAVQVDNNDLRETTGFPSEYSKRNEVELFAVVATELLMVGQATNNDNKPSSQAIKIDELVVERLQTAMPSIDVRALIAARTMYPDGLDVQSTLKRIVESHVSPLDTSIINAFPGEESVVTPAIHIISNDGKRVEHIRAVKEFEEDGNSLTTISLKRTDDTSFDEALIQKAIRYLGRPQDGVYTTDNITVRLTDNGIVDAMAYEVQSSVKPTITREDYRTDKS